MNLSECNHVRVRDNSGFEISVEKLIKVIETKFKSDFTSLPQWKEVIKCMSDKKDEYKNKIKSANLRKLIIIEKLHTQIYRPSPFVLTDKLARTTNLWKELKLRCKQQKAFLKADNELRCPLDTYETDNPSGESSDVKLTAHPNSEIVMTEDIIPGQTTVEVDAQSSVISHLPVNICTNQHKLLSPLESEFSALNIKLSKSTETDIFEAQSKDWLPFNGTESIQCIPPAIIIDIEDEDNTSELRKVKLSLSNRSNEVLFLQFKCLSDTVPFKNVFLYPVTCAKLYPGLAKVFTICYKLASVVKPFELFLYFRIGHTATINDRKEVLSIPMYSKITDNENLLDATETINITPVYSWQIDVNSNFPRGTLEISVNDKHCYYMHVKKREVNFAKETEIDDLSVDVTGLYTDSVLQRLKDDDLEVTSGLWTVSKKDKLLLVDEIELTSRDIIALIVEDIIELALDTFVFEKTCLYVYPHTRYCISVYFIKAKHVGYHHCYYDLNLYDADTQRLIITKTVKIFAEILPHPVQIHPTILDMSESPINYGFREDRILVRNTHKFYAATLKILLTKNMKRLIQIHPMELTVPYNSSVSLIVRLCSKKFNINKQICDMVHFTIKMIVTGHKSVYRNAPPFFYEIIAPCAFEFKQITRTS